MTFHSPYLIHNNIASAFSRKTCAATDGCAVSDSSSSPVRSTNIPIGFGATVAVVLVLMMSGRTSYIPRITSSITGAAVGGKTVAQLMSVLLYNIISKTVICQYSVKVSIAVVTFYVGKEV